MQKYYIDTSIWIDYFESREDRFRPLGEWAFELFKKIINEQSIAYYSVTIEIELKRKFPEKTIKEIFEILENNLTKIEIEANDINSAKELAKKHGVPAADALHAVLAKKVGAILVSRDSHFIQLSEIVEVKKPEDLI